MTQAETFDASPRASVLIAQDGAGRYLFQLRDNLPDLAAAGQFSLFGGHIEADEAPLTAAIREFHEETGIRLGPENLEARGAITSAPPRNMRLYVFYVTRAIEVPEVSVREGAGFAFLEPSQFDKFPMNPDALLALKGQ